MIPAKMSILSQPLVLDFREQSTDAKSPGAEMKVLSSSEEL